MLGALAVIAAESATPQDSTDPLNQRIAFGSCPKEPQPIRDSVVASDPDLWI